MPDIDTPEVDTPEKAVKHVRPLGVSQAKQLEKLVDNDFNHLAREIRQHGKELQEAKTKELQAHYNTEQGEKYVEKAMKLAKTYMGKLRELEKEAKEAGFRLSAPGITTENLSMYNPTFKVENPELVPAIQQASRDITNEVEAALHILETKRLAAQRRVLVASITSDAEKIMNDIPSARELMVEGAAERAQRKEISQ